MFSEPQSSVEKRDRNSLRSSRPSTKTQGPDNDHDRQPSIEQKLGLHQLYLLLPAFVAGFLVRSADFVF